MPPPTTSISIATSLPLLLPLSSSPQLSSSVPERKPSSVARCLPYHLDIDRRLPSSPLLPPPPSSQLSYSVPERKPSSVARCLPPPPRYHRLPPSPTSPHPLASPTRTTTAELAFIVSQEAPPFIGKSMCGRIIGSTGVILVVIAIFSFVFTLFKSYTGGSGNLLKNPDVQISHKFHVLQRPRFCYTSEKFLCFKLRRSKPSGCDISNSQISTRKEWVMSIIFEGTDGVK